MRSAFRAAVVVFVLLSAAVCAVADVASPGWEWPWEREKRRETRTHIMMRRDPLHTLTLALPLSVYANPETKQSTVILPRSFLTQLRAELPPTDDSPRTAGLPVQNTIIVGLALSAALVLGGLWVARCNKRRALIGFTCLLGAVVVVGLSCGPSNKEVRDNSVVIGPWQTPTLQSDGTLAGRCQVDRGEGDEVVVGIDRQALTKLAQQESKPEAPKP